MWMNVKCFPECVSMASASTHQAPFSASALQEWLLTSAAGRALVGTVNVQWYWCHLHVFFSLIISCIKSIIQTTWYSTLLVTFRPAYGAVLPHPWGRALWGSRPRKAPRGCLLLLSGCRLGPRMWRMSRKGLSRVHPAVSPWSRLLTQGWLHQRQTLPQRYCTVHRLHRPPVWFHECPSLSLSLCSLP